MGICTGIDQITAYQPEDALERLHYYQRLLGLPADPNAPDTLPLDFSSLQLNEDELRQPYNTLVGQYDKALSLQQHGR